MPELLKTTLTGFALSISLLFHPVMASTSPVPGSAVILMYHHVSETTPAITSVTPDTFTSHLDYLQENSFSVWPLEKVLKHLVNDKVLPDKTVVITFDDAYISVYETAYPELKKRGWPFTVFVTTQYINTGYKNFMSWQQLQEIESNGASIGNHSHRHPHLIRHRQNETQQEWLQRAITEIDTAQSILKEKLQYPLPVFAYPYGEYSTEIQSLLQRSGYYGIGQHSGAVGATSNPYALPRFPMATGFDDMENFAIKVNSKPLPVIASLPADGVLTAEDDVARLQLIVADGDYNRSRLACYASGQGRIQAQWHETDNQRLLVEAAQILQPGRTKFNCTAPSLSRKNTFYWYSFLWMKPEADGNWYQE